MCPDNEPSLTQTPEEQPEPAAAIPEEPAEPTLPPDGSTFVLKVVREAPESVPTDSEFSQPAEPAASPPPSPRKISLEPEKRRTVPIIIGIVAGVLLLAVLIYVLLIYVFRINRPDDVQVDLQKYISVTFDGYDGLGTASVSIDRDRFLKDYGTALVWVCPEKNQPDESVAELILENISAVPDRSDGLSNGDTVTVTIQDSFSDYDRTMANFFGNNAVLSSDLLFFTVEGLQEPETFDPFEGASVDIEGPQGSTSVTLTLRTEPAAMASLLIRTDDSTTALHNGDVLHYYIADYDDEARLSLIRAYGMVPSVTEWDYTVEGLTDYGYITDASYIPSSFSSDAEEAITEYYSSDSKFGSEEYQDYDLTLESIETAGTIFWVSKDGERHYDVNVMYVLFAVTISYPDTDEDDQTLTYYTFARYSDLYRNEDNSVTFYEESFDRFSDGWLDYPSLTYYWDTIDVETYEAVWTTTGYLSLDDCRSAIHASQESLFDCVSEE